MDFKDKYIKYKNKYLELQKLSGGYIKGLKEIKPINEDCTVADLEFLKAETKLLIDNSMKLCTFSKIKNAVLINLEGYILINNKVNEDFKLYLLDDEFDITKINNNTLIIKDNILIPGINRLVNGINLVQSYKYHNSNIFREFIENLPNSRFIYFDRLVKIIYTSNPDEGVVYQNNMNIVMALIFMNQLDKILNIIYTINDRLTLDFINYHNPKKLSRWNK